MKALATAYNLNDASDMNAFALVQTIPFDVVGVVMSFCKLHELVAAMAVCRAFRYHAHVLINQAWPTFQPLFERPFNLNGWDLLNKPGVFIANQLRDDDMNAFSTAIANGALGQLKTLDLRGNKIGDKDMSAFSAAIASGSLGKLEKLFLYNNQIGDEGMEAFSTAIASGSWRSSRSST